MDPIDLRSDTVTRPTSAMREALAQAVVGDDVFGDDPTVEALEEDVAARVGMQAGLFVPSGTMGNQLALRAQTEPGDQLVCHADAHLYWYEGGAPAVLSGLQITPISSDDGNLSWDAVERSLLPDDVHCARPAMVAFENTHNRCGGRVLDIQQTRRTAERARSRGLRVHLDGARLWNAAAASGRSLSELAEPFDSVNLCLSKGLGAPVGSVLASSRDVVRRARRVRKQWGGGMRQSGVLAAAGLHALEHHLGRLGEDHRRAAELARGVDHPELRLVRLPETNIILFDVLGARSSQQLASEWADAGLWVSAFGPRRVRMVTHLGILDSDVERALEILSASAAGSTPPGGGAK